MGHTRHQIEACQVNSSKTLASVSFKGHQRSKIGVERSKRSDFGLNKNKTNYTSKCSSTREIRRYNAEDLMR